VLGEIGRGMGAVSKGHDVDLGRDWRSRCCTKYARRPEVLARFVDEAQIGGATAAEPSIPELSAPAD